MCIKPNRKNIFIDNLCYREYDIYEASGLCVLYLTYLTFFLIQHTLKLAPEQRPSIDECIQHKAFTNEMNSNENFTEEAEKSESLKAPVLALNNCEDQKQGRIKEKLENTDLPNNNEESSQSVDPNDECLVKSAISEPQLKLDFSMLNKKESFMKIKPPVPKQIPTDQVSGSIESEASSSDGRTFKVQYRFNIFSYMLKYCTFTASCY